MGEKKSLTFLWKYLMDFFCSKCTNKVPFWYRTHDKRKDTVPQTKDRNSTISTTGHKTGREAKWASSRTVHWERRFSGSFKDTTAEMFWGRQFHTAFPWEPMLNRTFVKAVRAFMLIISGTHFRHKRHPGWSRQWKKKLCQKYNPQSFLISCNLSPDIRTWVNFRTKRTWLNFFLYCIL